MFKCSLFVSLFAVLFPLLSTGVAAAGQSGYAVIDSLKPGGEGGWDFLTVDPVSHTLYVSRSTHVQVVDLGPNMTPAGDIPNTPGVHGVALAPGVGEGYTSNGRDSTVTVFDSKTLQTKATIRIECRNPDAILFDPSSQRIFTFNGGSSNSTAIDVHTHKIVGTIDLGGRPEVAVSDSTGRIYVNLEDKNAVAQIDPRALKVMSVWPLAPGEGPTGLAIDRKHHRLFSACGNGHLVVLDSDSGGVIADLPIGPGVDGAAFDPATGLAFTSNGGDGTLTVIHEERPAKFTVLENVPTRRGARTMDLDPVTHRIYLATAAFGPPPPPTADRPHPRPTILPGSFVLLVVAR